MKFFRWLLSSTEKHKKPTTDFSAFFLYATASEKKKRMKDVLKKANEDQRQILQEYDRMTPRSA